MSPIRQLPAGWLTHHGEAADADPLVREGYDRASLQVVPTAGPAMLEAIRIGVCVAGPEFFARLLCSANNEGFSGNSRSVKA